MTSYIHISIYLEVLVETKWRETNFWKVAGLYLQAYNFIENEIHEMLYSELLRRI